jgi:hypothetical protein
MRSSRFALGALAALAVAGTGCAYGFAGGGFPPEIRTAAVLPFENDTADPTLVQQVVLSVREAVERRLGLRSASEARADAVVRGRITRYEPDVPVAFTGTGQGAGRPNQVAVSRRLVQITLQIEIIEQASGKVLYQNRALNVEGQYDPGREAEGRRIALENIINEIVKGAQSQW